MSDQWGCCEFGKYRVVGPEGCVIEGVDICLKRNQNGWGKGFSWRTFVFEEVGLEDLLDMVSDYYSIFLLRC